MAAAQVLIGGYLGYGNLGDEANLLALLEGLKEHLPEVEPVVLSAAPARTARDYGVRAISRWNLSAIWRELGRSQLLVLSGGGLIQDRTSRRSALYYLGLVRLAQLRRRGVFLLGQGLGPLQSPPLVRLARRWLRRADYIMVRDEKSLELLRGWGLQEVEDKDKDRLTRGYDLALALAVEPEPKPESEPEGVLMVALREAFWGSRARRAEAIGELAAALVEAQRRWGLRVAFFPLHPQRDLGLIEEVRRAMLHLQGVGTGAESLLLDPSELGVPEALKVVAQARLLLGMRLHALEFALIAGVPFIALSYDPKVEEFLKLVHEVAALELPLLDLAELSRERLVGALARLMEEQEALREELQGCAARLRELARASLAEACERMGRFLTG